MQVFFLLTTFADATSALLGYFLTSQLTKGVSRHKAVVKLGCWTALFFTCILLILVLFLINTSFSARIPAVFIYALVFTFGLFPCNFVFIGTWIFGALLVTHETPEGY